MYHTIIFILKIDYTHFTSVCIHTIMSLATLLSVSSAVVTDMFCLFCSVNITQLLVSFIHKQNLNYERNYVVLNQLTHFLSVFYLIKINTSKCNNKPCLRHITGNTCIPIVHYTSIPCSSRCLL